MRVKHFLLVLLLLVCSSCNYFKPPEYPEYDIPKTSNNSDKLRLDGYYYFRDNDSSIRFRVLYRNGVIIFCSSGFSNIPFEELNFDNYERNISCWGVYLIEEDTITYNDIYTDIDRKYKSNITKGIILNDTTFKLLYTKGFDGKITQRKEVFHFKQYSPKPDSTNIFTDR